MGFSGRLMSVKDRTFQVIGFGNIRGCNYRVPSHPFLTTKSLLLLSLQNSNALLAKHFERFISDTFCFTSKKLWTKISDTLLKHS